MSERKNAMSLVSEGLSIQNEAQKNNNAMSLVSEGITSQPDASNSARWTMTPFLESLVNPTSVVETVKVGSKSKTDPFSPANTGVPVRVYDADGNQIGGLWDVNDENGLKDAMESLERGESTKLYYNSTTGKFANYPISVMTFKDGKINLSLADDVANSSWFKEAFEGDEFKSLADLYKLDPTGNTKISYTRKDENGNDINEEKTINSLLEEYANLLDQNSREYKKNIDSRTRFSRLTHGRMILTDDDLAIISSAESFSKDKRSNTDAVFLPDFAEKFFKDFESYNAEDGTISADDWYNNFFYLDKELTEREEALIEEFIEEGREIEGDKETIRSEGESARDYAIDVLRRRTVDRMVEIVENMADVGDILTDEERARATTEYAKCYALQSLMNKDTPGSTPWTGFNLLVQAVWNGMGEEVTSFLENATVLYGKATFLEINALQQPNIAVMATLAALGNVFSNFFEGGFGKVAEDFDETTKAFSSVYAMFYGDSGLTTEIQRQFKKIDDDMKAGQTAFSSHYRTNIDDLASSYAGTEAGVRIGKIVGYAIEQITVINPVGQAVGSAVGDWGSAATAIVGGGFDAVVGAAKTIATFAEFGSSSLTILRSLKILNAMNAAYNIAGFAANIMAQGIVETFLERPDLVDATINGLSQEDTADFQDTLRWNLIFNAGGEFLPFAGKGARWGMKKFTSTEFGEVVQAIGRKAVNWNTIKGRKFLENISEFMTRKQGELVEQDGTKVLNPRKRWQELRNKIIDFQEQIKQTKIFDEDGALNNARKIDKLIEERIAVEEQLGTSKKLYQAELTNKIIKKAGLEPLVAQISEYTAKISQMSRKIGQANMPGSFSKQTGDYMNDLFNRQLLENKKAWAAENSKAFKDEEALELLNGRIAKYEKTIPTEYRGQYKEAVKGFMDANYKFYYKLNSYLASDAGGNLISKETLKKMRTAQYGPNGSMYMRLIPVSGPDSIKKIQEILEDPSKMHRIGKTENRVDLYSRKKFSPDTTYLDPNYTRDLYVKGYARVTSAAQMTDAIKNIGKATSIETDASGNIVKSDKDVQKAKKDFYRDIKAKFEKAFMENKKELGQVTIATTQKKAKAYFSTMKRQANRTINQMLGLDVSGLKRYAATIEAPDIEQLKSLYDLPAYSRKIRTRAELDEMYNSLSDAQKKVVTDTLDGRSLTISNWNNMVSDSNLDISLYRLYIKNDQGLLKSKFYKDMVAKARAKDITEEEALALRNSTKDLAEAEAGLKSGDFSKTEEAAVNKTKKRKFKDAIRGTISDAVEQTADGLLSNPYLDRLIKELEKQGISTENAKRYIIYQWLYENKGSKGVVEDIALNYYAAESKVSGIKISKDAAKSYSKKFRKEAESIIESKLNKTVKNIQSEGVDGLIDMESTVKRVNDYLYDIADKYESHQIVEAFDRSTGQFKYYQVSRGTYNLVTNYPTYSNYNGFVRFMAKLNSLARVGQIVVRGASLVTQGFKDTINAVVLGGWDTLLLDNPDTYKKIAEYVGQDVVNAFKKEMTPEAWEDFLASARWDGLTVEEAIAKSEVESSLLNLKIEQGPGTSSSYFDYRRLYGDTDTTSAGIESEINITKDTWTDDVKAKWAEGYNRSRTVWYRLKKGSYDTVNALHNARETFLRRQVYRQNFMDSLAKGKSLQQARYYAQYVMENATTNFARGFAWGDSIIRCIPYFGAALNGASSMIRLLEVDPVGIMLRFNTDLVMPVIGLTAMSLSNPLDAEIYKNIPEYEKEGNLHWVVNGQKITIPLPEELAKFILPIRHAVESMAGANDHAFGELMINDLLNMPTIPLNDVMMLDQNKIYGDPTVFDRVGALAMGLFNVLSPNAARTAYIAMFKKDPYTGEDYGRGKWFLDSNGDYQYMTESEYDFVNDLATLFKSWGWNDVSAIMAEALLSSTFGTGSMDWAEGIRDLISSAQNGSPDITALFSPSMERAGKVLSKKANTDEREAQTTWYGLIKDLNNKKNELLSPKGELAQYSKDIDMAKSQKSLEESTQKYDSKIRDWQNYVMGLVKNYVSQYGEYYDRQKFASTISVMVGEFSNNRERNSDAYYNARAIAIETMYDAGFDSPSDRSIFGYAYRDPDSGRITIKYTNPLVVSMSQNLSWYQADDAVRAIKDTVELSGLKNEYNNKVYPAYNNAMKNKDYATANEIAADWDEKFVKEIKPLIDSYTVGNLLDNSTAIDYLDGFILVPNTKDAIGAGQYYSSKTGLNKRRGFAQAYIKKVYKALSGEKE